MPIKKALAATAIAIGLAVCAATYAKESKVMQSTSTNAFQPYTPKEYPQITPAVMSSRVLKLIDSLKTPDDWTPSHIQQVIDLPLTYLPDSNVHTFTMHLPDSDWYYSLDYKDGSTNNNKSISYRFDNWADGHSNENADMHPVCGMDQDTFSAKLRSLGFSEKPEYGEIGQIEWITYRRQGTSTSVEVSMRAEGQSTDDKKQHNCLKLIMIYP